MFEFLIGLTLGSSIADSGSRSESSLSRRQTICLLSLVGAVLSVVALAFVWQMPVSGESCVNPAGPFSAAFCEIGMPLRFVIGAIGVIELSVYGLFRSKR
jgi:hypothetical protein